MFEQSLLSRKELIELLREDKEFRDAFALEYVKNSIPTQIRALRKEREWTQADLGKATKKPRNVITRLENPNNNIPNLSTLYEIATSCEAALLVKIVPFSELLKEYEKPYEVSQAPSIFDKKELEKLQSWAEPKSITEQQEVEEIPKSYKLKVVQGNDNPEPQLPLFRPQLVDVKSKIKSKETDFQEIILDENNSRNIPVMSGSTKARAAGAR